MRKKKNMSNHLTYSYILYEALDLVGQRLATNLVLHFYGGFKVTSMHWKEIMIFLSDEGWKVSMHNIRNPIQKAEL